MKHLIAIASILVATSVSRADMCIDVFQPELDGQNWQLRGLDQKYFVPTTEIQYGQGKFNLNRNLDDYKKEITAPAFEQDLRSLGRGDRFVDFAAGNMKAVAQFINENSNPNVSVVAFAPKVSALPKNPDTSRVQMFVMRQLEQMDPKQIPEYSLGVDVFGQFSTTKHFDFFIRASLNRLLLGGRLYIRADFFKTAIITKKGFRMNVIDWLRTIKEIEYRVSNNGKFVMITRISEGAVRPNVMKLVRFEETEDGVPYRIFQEI